MQLNVIVVVLLLNFLKKLYSVPLHTVNKGSIFNELIRYYEPAMYKPQEIVNFHNRRKREVGGIAFNKPLRISFRAHDRDFNLVLRTEDKIFADDVVFDSTSHTVSYDTRRVYTGVLEGEENSYVEGVVTREGLFDGTIFSKNEIFYVEPVSRYTPSKHEHQNSSSIPRNIHTIIYKTSDVKIPPSLRNPCASQILHLTRTESESNTVRTKEYVGSESGDHVHGDRGNGRESSSRNSETWNTHENVIFERGYDVASHRKRDKISSLPIVSSHDEIIESNILKTYINSQDDSRIRKKVNDSSVSKHPKHVHETKVHVHNNVMINRPRVILNRTLTGVRQTSGKYQEYEEVLSNGTLKHVIKRATIDPKKTTCMLYLQADHLFYQKYGTEEACIEVMTRHVQRVNSIYKNTDFNQDGKSDNISFMIKRIKVHTSESSKDPSYRFPGNYGVEKFLELFSEEDYDAFCLAYMFTYRDFEMGTLGLAWTGDLKNAGGVCEKNGHYRGSLKSLNTGIVTLLNYGKHVPPAVSHVTLAHEIGHNFGSPHDPESCTPGGEDGNYIMFARATSGDKKNNNKFSPCSLNSINPVLNSKARSQMGCFTEPQVSICGNGVVEVGEDCDCGWEEDCRDSCCFPQRRYPPPGEPPCRLTPNSICSPSQGPCCTSECQLKFGDKCRDDNGCRDSSFCDGRSPSCPPSVNKPNKTICNDEFVCFMGECTGSICLAYGLESCQCIPGPKDSLTKACELCCKKPGDDQPCISSFEWNESPYDVPDMFSKPGTPCNDYNGYCDVFQKCREVDPSGPLATLRKLLLSEESLASFKRWVSEHWYAVVVIVASIIFLLVLSTKLLGKHQDVKLKSITVIHSSTTETVRLPSDGDAGMTIHPPAIRNKLPLHRKVREKKLHTKVTSKKNIKNKNHAEGKKVDGLGKKVEEGECVPAKRSKPTTQKHNEENVDLPKNSKKAKHPTKSQEYKREISQESSKTQESGKIKTVNGDRPTGAKKHRKQKTQEEVCKTGNAADSKPKLSLSIHQNCEGDEDKANLKSDSSPLVPTSPSSPSSSGPIYESIECLEDQAEGATDTPPTFSNGKVRSSKIKHSNTVPGDVIKAAKKSKEGVDEKAENVVKVSCKKSTRPKMSPSKKKKKKEVVEYSNEESHATVTKATNIPAEDPLGKVQNWLMHSIPVGKTSENFGIMTLTLPKSKSSPVGFSGKTKSGEVQTKTTSPPKIIHKNDKVVQIPKITHKRSRSTGNLRKSDKKDEKMKLQVVYKPPFKFSVKLRNNRILGTVGTRILNEKSNGSQPNRKSAVNGNEKIHRTAVLVRTLKNNTKSKSDKKNKTSPQVTTSTPDRVEQNGTENPFTFPSGVAPMSVTSLNSKQLPIYLTDQVEIDSNVHTVPSDLDVLLSESKFLFSDS